MTSLFTFSPLLSAFFPYFCLQQHFTVTSSVCVCHFVSNTHPHTERVCLCVCVCDEGAKLFSRFLLSLQSHILSDAVCVLCACVCQAPPSPWRIICLLLRGRRQVLSKQASHRTPLSLSLSESTHIFLL